MSEFCNVGPNERQARLELAERSALNGIEYIEVLDRVMPGGISLQKTLVVVCIKDLLPEGTYGALGPKNVQITGGTRVTKIDVLWAHQGVVFNGSGNIPQDVLNVRDANGRDEYYAISQVVQDRFASRLNRVLVVRTDATGDFSQYTLSLVSSAQSLIPPNSFDTMLSSVGFSFKIECPTDFDCGQGVACPVEERQAPTIDYLAKDYDSFRTLILDRLSVIVPDWKERNPADVGITLVELLAYAGDQLSYYQDVVANEAYLGTARLRTSVRRHARLLDYRLHEGSNARTWVHLDVDEGATFEAQLKIPQHTQLLSRRPQLDSVVSSVDAKKEIDAGATVFETMEDLTVYYAHNEIRLHLWGATSLVLRKGTTCATVRNTGAALQLREGDLIAFVEEWSFQPDPELRPVKEDADPSKRHVVRLTSVQSTEDPLILEVNSPPQPQQLLDLEWSAADALPFDLCVMEFPNEADGQTKITATSVVWGNIVLADHGRSQPETVTPVPRGMRSEAPLSFGPLTFQGQVLTGSGVWQAFDGTAPASSALVWDPGHIMPSISMTLDGGTWLPNFDLLESEAFDREFVVETEDDGTARVRFGDGINGELPTGPLAATYRVGNGTSGNVGQETLVHIVLDNPDWKSRITRVVNVIPAVGGSDPEAIEHAILVAPHAFRTQERAVTEEDYAAVAERHPEVQKAVAVRRFLGSWDVFFISVDRLGGQPVDAAFKQEMRDFIEPFRLAGHDVEIREPRFVPLDIVLPICVSPGHLRSQVLVQLQEVFSAATLPGKAKGLFHPDNLTFGQPIYLSGVIAAAMAVPGVLAVLTDVEQTEFRFRRYLSPDNSGEVNGVIKVGISEIASVASDPNQPMNGKIDFRLRGGL